MSARQETFTTQGNIESKQPERDRIARDIAAYKSKGGKVDVIAGFEMKGRLISDAGIRDGIFA